jgi:serine/threonine-protein phosphatase 2B catalytic subunit
MRVLGIVADMLVAVLNTCSREETMESSDEESVVAKVSPASDAAERRRIVRSKILAVGRMACVFSVLRLANFPFHCSRPHAEFIS